MNNIVIIAKRIILELKGDKRTIALLIIAPLFLMTLINILFNADYKDIELGYVNNSNVNIEFNDDINITDFDNFEIASQSLEDSDVDAILITDLTDFELNNDNLVNISEEQKEFLSSNLVNLDITGNEFSLYLKGEDPIYDSCIQSEVASSLSGDSTLLNTTNVYYSYDLLDELMILMLEFVIIFFSFLTVGISFLRERQNFTLERTLTSNMKRYQLVLGYLTGYGLVAVIQSIVLELYLVYVLDMQIYGSLLLSILMNILVALVGISLGTTLSAFAKNEFQIMQFIPIVIIPQIIFSGVLPYNDIYQTISLISPMTYATNIQKSILLQDNLDIIGGVLFLIAVIIIFNLITIKKLRKVRDI